MNRDKKYVDIGRISAEPPTQRRAPTGRRTRNAIVVEPKDLRHRVLGLAPRHHRPCRLRSTLAPTSEASTGLRTITTTSPAWRSRRGRSKSADPEKASFAPRTVLLVGRAATPRSTDVIQRGKRTSPLGAMRSASGRCRSAHQSRCGRSTEWCGCSCPRRSVAEKNHRVHASRPSIAVRPPYAPSARDGTRPRRAVPRPTREGVFDPPAVHRLRPRGLIRS